MHSCWLRTTIERLAVSSLTWRIIAVPDLEGSQRLARRRCLKHSTVATRKPGSDHTDENMATSISFCSSYMTATQPAAPSQHGSGWRCACAGARCSKA